MSQKKKKHILLFLVCIVIILCCSYTNILNVSYVENLPMITKLKNLAPISFRVDKFKDDRKVIIASYIEGGDDRSTFYFSKDVRDIVEDAIKNELSMQGHKISTEPENCNIIIIGSITDFWADIKSAMWVADVDASIRVNILLKNAQTSDILLSKIFLGNYNTGGLIGWPGKSMNKYCEIALNEALKNFLNSLLNDEEFIQACKTVS